MDNQTNIFEVRQRAFDKLEQEFNEFLTQLKSQSKENIINTAYAVVEKETILNLFHPQNEFFCKNQLDAVLHINEPLDFLYNTWLSASGTSFDELTYCVKDNLNKEYDRIQSLSQEKTRVFVDMDGVLAEFNKVDKIEDLYEADYFANLKPMNNVVAAINHLNNDPMYDVYILSSVLKDSKFAVTEKLSWLEKYMPEIRSNLSNVIFSECGKSKVGFVPNGVRRTDILLDDYTKNLNEWKQAGGKAVKVINGINNKTHRWQGDKVYATSEPLEITRDICFAAGKDNLTEPLKYEPILPNQIPDMGGMVQS